MQLPRKLQSGDWFKPSTFRTVNGIIDYLATQRVVGDNQTIKVSQQNTGLTISAIPNPYGGSATITAVVLPFKLTVTDNGTTKTLKVEKGIVRTAKTDLIFAYTDITLPTADGIYNIYGYVQYNGSFSNGVFLIDSTKTVANRRGFYTFKIGTIEVKIENSETTYTITEQTAKSDIEIIDYQIFQPFCVYCYNNTSLHNTIQTENVLPNSFQVNAGAIYVDTHNNHLTPTYTGSTGEAKYIYLQLTVNDPQSHDATIIISDSTLVFFDGTSPTDGQTDKYNFLLAHISADAEIQQHITGDIVYGQTKDEVEEDPSQSVNETKITSSTLAVSSSDGTNVTTWNIDFAIDDSCKIFKMNEKKFSLANSTYGLVYNGGSSLGVYAPPSSNQLHYLSAKNGVISWVQPQYKVKVNVNDTADYLGTKFESTDQSVNITVNANNKIDLSVNSKIKVNNNDPTADWLQNKIQSDDNSIDINVNTYNNGYKLNLSGGKVLVDNSDTQADYLGEKLISTDHSVTFSKVYGSGTELDLSAPKVKLYSDDSTAGYLEEKIRSDDSLLNLLLLMPIDDILKLVCTASNCLFYADADSTIQKIDLPSDEGDFALTFSSSTGGFKWVKITDCENACKQQDIESTTN